MAEEVDVRRTVLSVRNVGWVIVSASDIEPLAKLLSEWVELTGIEPVTS